VILVCYAKLLNLGYRVKFHLQGSSNKAPLEGGLKGFQIDPPLEQKKKGKKEEGKEY